MERKLIMAFAALFIIMGGIQTVTSRPDWGTETVPAEILIEPETLKVNSNAQLYATISLEKYDVTKIQSVIMKVNEDEIPGIFQEWILDEEGEVISVKYSFDRDTFLEIIAPDNDETVSFTIEGDISSKWREILFSGDGEIKIKV
jgi:hypothetical protein